MTKVELVMQNWVESSLLKSFGKVTVKS